MLRRFGSCASASMTRSKLSSFPRAISSGLNAPAAQPGTAALPVHSNQHTECAVMAYRSRRSGFGDETGRRNHAGRCDSPSHPGRLRLWAAGELLTHATERSYTAAWMVRVAGAMDQRRLFNLSTTGPAKRVSPHWLHTQQERCQTLLPCRARSAHGAPERAS